MTQNDLKAEITYLKDMAEAGQTAPLLGGRFSIWWGGLTSLTMLIHWAIMSSRLPLGGESLLPLWLGYMVIGSIGTFVLARSMKDKPGQGSVGNRLQPAIWQSIGGTILVYFLAILIGVLTDLLPNALFNSILPVALLGYGAAWLTTARMVQSWQLAIPGLIALLGAFASTLFMMTAEVYLIAAIAFFLSTAVPGFLLMCSEPEDVV